MPQLHLYIPDDLSERIQNEAQAANVSVSRYLAELVRREMTPEWPEGYFEEVIGGWQGEPLLRAPQGEFEEREALGTVR